MQTSQADINKLVLGTAQLGSSYGINNKIGKLKQDQAFRVLDAAWDNGIDCLDTAEAYGDSHRLIGEYHSEHPDRRFKICTKLSAGFNQDQNNAAASILRRVQRGLSELHCASIDVYYLHSFEMCKSREIIAAFEELKNAEMIRHIGVSIYEPEELDFLIKHMSDVIDVVQIPFNVFNCSQWLSNERLSVSRKLGISLYARSVYVQGIIFMDQADKFIQKLNLSEMLQDFIDLADRKQLTKEQLACDFVRSTTEIDRIVLGSETPEQVKNNVSIFLQPCDTWSTEEYLGQLATSKTIPQKNLDPRFWN